MTKNKTVIIGNCTLIHGDCYEVQKTLGGFYDLITDPPYGIKMDRGAGNSDRKRFKTAPKWDGGIVDLTPFLHQCRYKIIFGGNYYTEQLPPSRRWIVWDKGESYYKMPLADCELAWCSFDGSASIFKYWPTGSGKEFNKTPKLHPTQKPLAVMRYCVGKLPRKDFTILDPFMGAGTTGIAAMEAGIPFVGIEREKTYFDIAVKRVSAVCGGMNQSTKPHLPTLPLTV